MERLPASFEVTHFPPEERLVLLRVWGRDQTHQLRIREINTQKLHELFHRNIIWLYGNKYQIDLRSKAIEPACIPSECFVIDQDNDPTLQRGEIDAYYRQVSIARTIVDEMSQTTCDGMDPQVSKKSVERFGPMRVTVQIHNDCLYVGIDVPFDSALLKEGHLALVEGLDSRDSRMQSSRTHLVFLQLFHMASLLPCESLVYKRYTSAIVFTGEFLGGAVAQLAALRACRFSEDVATVRAITFHAASFGTLDLASYIDLPPCPQSRPAHYFANYTTPDSDVARERARVLNCALAAAAQSKAEGEHDNALDVSTFLGEARVYLERGAHVPPDIPPEISNLCSLQPLVEPLPWLDFEGTIAPDALPKNFLQPTFINATLVRIGERKKNPGGDQILKLQLYGGTFLDAVLCRPGPLTYYDSNDPYQPFTVRRGLTVLGPGGHETTRILHHAPSLGKFEVILIGACLTWHEDIEFTLHTLFGDLPVRIPLNQVCFRHWRHAKSEYDLSLQFFLRVFSLGFLQEQRGHSQLGSPSRRILHAPLIKALLDLEHSVLGKRNLEKLVVQYRPLPGRLEECLISAKPHLKELIKRLDRCGVSYTRPEGSTLTWSIGAVLSLSLAGACPIPSLAQRLRARAGIPDSPYNFAGVSVTTSLCIDLCRLGALRLSQRDRVFSYSNSLLHILAILAVDHHPIDGEISVLERRVARAFAQGTDHACPVPITLRNVTKRLNNLPSCPMCVPKRGLELYQSHDACTQEIIRNRMYQILIVHKLRAELRRTIFISLVGTTNAGKSTLGEKLFGLATHPHHLTSTGRLVLFEPDAPQLQNGPVRVCFCDCPGSTDVSLRTSDLWKRVVPISSIVVCVATPTIDACVKAIVRYAREHRRPLLVIVNQHDIRAPEHFSDELFEKSKADVRDVFCQRLGLKPREVLVVAINPGHCKDRYAGDLDTIRVSLFGLFGIFMHYKGDAMHHIAACLTHPDVCSGQAPIDPLFCRTIGLDSAPRSG